MSERPLPPRVGARRRPLQRMILRNTAALPALVTLLNGIAGFSSMYYATKDGLSKATVEHLTLAAWLIFVAMGCDALDGRLARITRRASDFGAQLDSLCDVISFGVAPAVLMLQTVSMALSGEIDNTEVFRPQASMLGKAVMAVAVLYVCCAVLRLARFNIENAPDVLSHMSFKGLPSPGAAAVVAAMVLLYEHLQVLHEAGKEGPPWLKLGAGVALPVLTFVVALLMISRFRYPHVVNQFIRGKKPFAFIVKAVAVIIAALVFLQLSMTLALGTVLFAVSGPIYTLRLRRCHLPPPPGAPLPPPAHQEPLRQQDDGEP